MNYIAEVRNELAGLMERIGSYHKTTGNLDKALEFFEEFNRLVKKLYEAHPNNVGFKYGLADSYLQLGDTHSALGNLDQENAIKAKEYYLLSKDLWAQLVNKFPQDAVFKKNLDWVESKLSER